MAWGNAEARTHLELGQQFLIIATHALEHGYANVAATLCINAAIHSNDAICLSEFGSSHRNLPYDMAGKQLRGIPGVGPGLSSGYSRILRGKSEVEYSSAFISQEAAATTLKRTEAFFQVVVGHLNR
jgi:hypothetical protein